MPSLVGRVKAFREGVGREPHSYSAAEQGDALKLENVSKIKGYYSPSRWEIVALMSLWHDVFQGTFQIPAHLILMTAREGVIIIVSSYR